MAFSPAAGAAAALLSFPHSVGLHCPYGQVTQGGGQRRVRTIQRRLVKFMSMPALPDTPPGSATTAARPGCIRTATPACIWRPASGRSRAIPKTPERLFAGTDMGAFRWDEPTARWTHLPSPMQDVWAVAVDPANPDTLDRRHAAGRILALDRRRPDLVAANSRPASASSPTSTPDRRASRKSCSTRSMTAPSGRRSKSAASTAARIAA